MNINNLQQLHNSPVSTVSDAAVGLNEEESTFDKFQNYHQVYGRPQAQRRRDDQQINTQSVLDSPTTTDPDLYARIDDGTPPPEPSIDVVTVSSPDKSVRMIGAVPIADYEGSPRRYFSANYPTTTATAHNNNKQLMTTQAAADVSPSTSTAARRPGFPQRVLTKAADQSIAGREKCDREKGNNTPTFDYLYEFSETRKVLDEFFKLQPPQQDTTTVPTTTLAETRIKDSVTSQQRDAELCLDHRGVMMTISRDDSNPNQYVQVKPMINLTSPSAAHRLTVLILFYVQSLPV